MQRSIPVSARIYNKVPPAKKSARYVNCIALLAEWL
jgi:hypothetical protein